VVDEPQDLVRVVDDMSRRPEADHPVAGFGQVHQPPGGDLVQQLVGMVDEGQVEALNLVAGRAASLPAIRQ
jgi:hypothetical protein